MHRLAFITGVWIVAANVACTRNDPGEQSRPPVQAMSTPPVASPLGSAAAHGVPSPSVASANAPTASAPSTPPSRDAVADRSAWPWLTDITIRAPAPVEVIEDRIAPPAGFKRVAVEPGSFGAWLRRLPMAAPGTPVRSYSGGVLLPADHPNIAGVVALDVGQGDLQQCADSIIRLHAEWQWYKGRRDVSYNAANGADMPFERWARGERVVAAGKAFEWKPTGRASSEHASFRKYLDAVFSYANTGSLSKQARPIGVEALAPGDFVVMPGGPGHAVLVLDLARSEDGRRVALLGQGFMPAQSFQVLRPNAHQTWFEIDAASAGLQTPFWPVFPWKLLRRW